MDTYAEIPYQSTPFPETHPAHLAPLARLFGLPAVDPAHCRVLELGCAAGGNLIPLAWQLPESDLVGVELSATQAADGAARIARLGLTNVRILAADLMTLGDELGQFDYIIAHGLYSWVPPAVQTGVLDLCQRLLTPHGIAYLSYNTLPGWRWRGQLREMLLYHTRAARSPGERLALAHELLGLLHVTYAEADGPEATYLRAEVERLRSRHPSYLYHEYLETDNHPTLFSDFVARVRGHGLDYLCDIDLASHFGADLPAPVEGWLEQQSDPIDYWQYLDLFGQRNFRQSLLCRADAPFEREVELDTFASFALVGALRPPKKLDLRRAKAAPFTAADGNHHPIHHPLTQAALAQLAARHPDAVAYTELAEQARRQLAAVGNPLANEEEQLRHELFSLYAHQLIDARLHPAAHSARQQERPTLLLPLRSDAAAGLDHLVGAHHTTLTLDPFSRYLASLLDGSRDRSQLLDQLCQAMLTQPELHALLTPEQAQQPARLRRLVEHNYEQVLGLFVRQGVLL